jgi:Spy/CpxP family protein refolding chaperone
MFHFVLAAIGLFALVRVLRRVGYMRRFGYAGYGCRGGSRGFGGPRSWLRSLFERMSTTPSQEKAILGALDELRSNRAAIVDEAKTTRADLAAAVSGGVVDDTTLEETFARHDRLVARLRVSFAEALKQISETLDERQRQQLADFLRNRRGTWFGGGPRWSDREDVWA